MDCDEIYNSCRNQLGIFFTREEAKLMTNFLDEDNNGEVDMQEFCKRITFLDFHKRSHQYIISEIQFLEYAKIPISEWTRAIVDASPQTFGRL